MCHSLHRRLFATAAMAPYSTDWEKHSYRAQWYIAKETHRVNHGKPIYSGLLGDLLTLSRIVFDGLMPRNSMIDVED